MFTGYNFFDYKYNIPGYNGQDYDNGGRYIFMVASIIIIFLFCILFRKAKKDTIQKYLKISSIVITALYIVKTTWESYYDISTGRGFNIGILPFDTCSIVMWASLLAGWGKGKAQKIGECWLATGGIVGGISNVLFLQALKYYPFFTFGAMYSMVWHLFMALTGFWLLVTNYVKSDMSTVKEALIFHYAISLFVIPFDYVTGYDFMLYLRAGGAPLVEDLASLLNKHHLQLITNIVVILFYFGLFTGIVYSSKGIKTLLGKINKKKATETC